MRETGDELSSNLQAQDNRNALEYPQILLETSFESLLNHSIPSYPPASTGTMTRLIPEPAPPSLSESWTSISDAELSQNEDLLSEHTDAESLVDIPGTDDGLSTQDDAGVDEEADEDDEHVVEDSAQARNVQASTTRPVDKDRSTGSSLTETNFLATTLMLDEPLTESQVSGVMVRHIFKSLDKDTIGDATEVADSADLAAALQLKLNKLSLKDSGRQSLRLLVLGEDFIPSLRSSIVSKVADALVASSADFDACGRTSPSRFHIVPDCFGPGSLPSTAELIPIDCQLEVDHYHRIRCPDPKDNAYDLQNTSTLKTITSTPAGIQGENWTQPDLAVILLSPEDHTLIRAQSDIYFRFCRRHCIPILLVSMNDTWTGPAWESLKLGMLQKAVLDRAEHGGKVLKRLPVDLDTFLSVDAAQLSRHLAWLVDDSRTEEADTGNQTLFDFDMFKAWCKEISPHVRIAGRGLRQVNPLFLSLVLALLLLQLLSGFWSSGIIGLMPSNTTVPSPTNVSIAMSSSTASSASLSTSTSTSTTMAATPTVMFPQPPLTIDASKSSSGRFELEVVSQRFLVVRTPHKPKGRRGVLTVDVSRGTKPIESEVKMLFPCVYSVHLADKHLTGIISVRLEITNPHLYDTVDIDLGPRAVDEWLKEIVTSIRVSLHRPMGRLQDVVQAWKQSDSNQRLAFQAKQLVSDVGNKFKFVSEYQKRMEEPLRRLEARRLAFNKRVDVKGAQMYADMTQWLSTHRDDARDLPKKAAVLFRMQLDALQAMVKKVDVRSRLHHASDQLHGKAHSETLATAQDRAQQVLREWRERKAARGRR